MSLRIAIALALAVPLVAPLAAPLAAQASPVTLPKIFKGDYSSSSNLTPLGRTRLFIQYWYNGDNLPGPMLVNQMGWRVDERVGPNVGPINHRMSIVLDNATVTDRTLTSTFAANLSGQQSTFLPLQDISFPSNPNDPDVPALWIPGQAPFFYQGPHLLVEVDIRTESTPRSNGFNSDAYSMAENPIDLETGISCGGRLTTTTSISPTGATLTWNLSNAPALAPVTLLVGIDNQELRGMTLPVDMGSVGLPGCYLYVDPIAFYQWQTDGAGSASATIPVTEMQGVTQQLFSQATHPGPGGLAMTNLATSALGDRGNSTYLFNWTSFGPDAQFGPYTTNRSPILLLR